MTGPEPAPRGEGPRADLDSLLGLLVTQATDLVERAGELAPFAARLREGGLDPELIPPMVDEEFPLSDAIIADLVAALQMEAENGSLRACGIAADVVVTLPGSDTRVDAVRVNLEHRDSPALAAYLPYRLAAGRWVYGDMLLTPGDSLVFLSDAS